MLRILTVAILVVAAASAAFANDFCNGFQRGYVIGYKRATGSSLDPIPPICPIQPIKSLGDPQSDYEHGYVLGIEHGLRAGSRFR